jgi:hypothetical protein
MPFGFWPLIAAVVCAGVLHVTGFRVSSWRPMSLEDEWVAYRLVED